MRVFKTSYRNRQGTLKTASKWYVEFKDPNEILRRLPAFTSKPASEEFGRNLERLVGYHRATGGQVDPTLESWLSTIPASARNRLVEIGVLKSERIAVGKPLESHINGFADALKAKSCSARHVDLVVGRLQNLVTACGFRHYSEISASKVMSRLSSMRGPDEKDKKGISAQTFNFYLQAIKQFCRWMVKDRRATQSPVAHLDGLNVRTDRRHDRRALSLEELTVLLNTTETGPVRLKIKGHERSLLYRVAVETGLRAGELRSLTAASFVLEGDAAAVKVAAAYSKNRRESTIPLRLATAQLLAEHLKQRTRKDTALRIPARRNVAKLLRDDLEAARNKWIEATKMDAKEKKRREESDFLKYTDRDGHKADFHALRHTFISNLAVGGVHPKTAQVLARHSTFALTMERYSHSQREQEVAAIATLPVLPLPAAFPVNGQKKPVQASQSGDSVLASCLAQIQTPGANSGDFERLNAASPVSSKTPKTRGKSRVLSGEGEIRTPATLAGRPVFETGAFSRSATSPCGTRILSCSHALVKASKPPPVSARRSSILPKPRLAPQIDSRLMFHF